MKIILRELENLCKAVLTRIENTNISSVYISKDYYWEAFFEDSCNEKIRPELIMGSLFADWEWLEKVLCKKNPMTNIDFYRLGNIITAIGNEFDKPQCKPALPSLEVKITDIKLLFDLIFTGAKKENINLEVIDTLFDEYWRVNLASIYDIYIASDPLINLQSLPDNIPNLTEHIRNNPQLDIQDFDQIGVLFKAIGFSAESTLFMFIDSNHDKE